MPTDNFAPVLDPSKARVLAHIGSLRRFHGGRGCELFDAEQRAYLDLGAGYGACALGHNPAVAVQALQRALAAEEPALVQPYQAPAALELAELLSRLTTLEHVCFGTSGADVVEAAMKLARVRTRRPWIVTASDAYHGQTLGALAASGRSQWPGGPGPAAFGCSQVPFGDASALAAELTARAGQVAAVMLEPIQGEGGVIVPPSGYLAEVATLCRARGVLLIVDEIQTGLGRTGRLLACEHEGVRPDILLLSKALGGGVFPLGAMLVDRDAWDPRFGMAHGTTFANHNLACRVGLATVDAVARPEFLAGVERKGALLGRLLTGLQARHPGVITAVRGRGLLAAIELRQPPGEGLISGYMYHHGLLAYAIAQAAAERHGVLFLPTLARGNVLRVTPPLVIADAEIERAIAALDEVLAPVSRGDVGGLLRSLGATAPRHADPDVAALQHGRIELPEQKIRVPAPAGRRFGFIIHYATLADLPTIEPSLASAQPGEIAAVAGWTARMPAGIVHRTGVLATIAGVPVDGLILAVPMLPEHMLRLGPKQMSEEITRAVDLAAAHGASVVGLGGYTTAYSRRGLDVAGRGPAITTGNTLTAVMAVRAVAAALRELPGLRAGCFEEADVAIVGARGSVGALLARLIARMRPRRLVLIGRPGGDEPRVRALAASLAGEVEVASDTAPLVDCSVVITATGSAQPALRGAPIAAGTLICDVARPFDAPRELRARTDVTVINGGLVALPDAGLRFGAGNIQGFPDGVQLACLAETLLLTLADTREDVGIGDDISLATADMVTRLAGQHDFRLAPLATPRPGTM